MPDSKIYLKGQFKGYRSCRQLNFVPLLNGISKLDTLGKYVM